MTDTIHIVAPGECLWTIAAAHYHPVDDAELAGLVRDLYLANTHLIGDDPNLIHPGQRLHLP